MQKLIAYCDVCHAQIPEGVKGVTISYYEKNYVYDAQCATSANERLDLCNACAMKAVNALLNDMENTHARLAWVRTVKTDKKL